MNANGCATRIINHRIALRWCAALVLLAGNPLYAQVCRPPTAPTCEQKCGPLREGNATEHANCLTECEHTPVCPPDFSIQVQVSGLTGGLLRVGESGGPLLAITTNGQFAFPVKVPYGHAYAVSVLSEPAGDKCTLSSPHSGNAYSPILVKVTCVGPPPQVRMSWESFVSGPDGAKRLASLIGGITKMKSLDSSPPNSADYRRSWQYWANIHGYYGAQSPDGTVEAHIQLLQSLGLGADVTDYQGIVDQSPPDSTAVSIWATCQHSTETIQALNFFGWHRMYLYYFEQVLRWAANDDTLRLPYWDYTNPADTGLPAEFRNTTSTLYDPLRNSNLNAGTSALNPAFTNIDQLLSQPDYFLFESSIEGGIHGYVHCTTGPTCPVAHMGDVPVAANDPIFFTRTHATRYLNEFGHVGRAVTPLPPVTGRVKRLSLSMPPVPRKRDP